jgi:hypothetical protein
MTEHGMGDLQTVSLLAFKCWIEEKRLFEKL